MIISTVLYMHHLFTVLIVFIFNSKASKANKVTDLSQSKFNLESNCQLNYDNWEIMSFSQNKISYLVTYKMCLIQLK
jgi:hypothetical protein